MDLSRHNGHPRFFGYVASPSTPIGAYADLIASALNANITCWRSGPAGTETRAPGRALARIVDWLRRGGERSFNQRWLDGQHDRAADRQPS